MIHRPLQHIGDFDALNSGSNKNFYVIFHFLFDNHICQTKLLEMLITFQFRPWTCNKLADA